MEASKAERDVCPFAGYFTHLGLISGGILFAIYAIVLLTPVAAGGSVQLKFSADLARLLAIPLGWLSNVLG